MRDHHRLEQGAHRAGALAGEPGPRGFDVGRLRGAGAADQRLGALVDAERLRKSPWSIGP